MVIQKSLEQLAQEINRLHGEVQALDTKMEELQTQIDETNDTRQEKARKIGEKLIEAKKRTQHGRWLSWLKKNCPEITERTAQQYMAFVRGDVDNLDSGGRRENTSAAPADSDLSDRQKKAIELVKQGKSYRQIGEELNTDESLIRKDPIIRQARADANPEGHIEIRTFGACEVRGAPQIYSLVKSECDLLLTRPITKEYRTKFINLFRETIEKMEKK